eukprot:TRINITY_DN9929_c0_g1_i1.p1 TRINITY_DN9929_c0_g1~~TRINITY_DN9929_c0_g1_i1.p1  ORF type:complete len:128 (+),score=17.58 TRINITY_DN9929_c0_g1_i1:121-504(+)
MELTIHTPVEKQGTFVVVLEKDTIVAVLKDKIEEVTGVPAKVQRLVYMTRHLDDNSKELQQYGVLSGEHVSMLHPTRDEAGPLFLKLWVDNKVRKGANIPEGEWSVAFLVEQLKPLVAGVFGLSKPG